MVCQFLLVSMVSQDRSTVIESLFSYGYRVVFPLIAFKTFILYYCNLTLMHLGIDFFGFILFWIFWASWLCMFISIFQVEGFSAIISSKNFQQHTIFSLWDSINTKGSVHFFFFSFYLSLFFILNKFIHLPVGFLIHRKALSILPLN